MSSSPKVLTALVPLIGLLLGVIPEMAVASDGCYDVVVVSGSSGGFAAALAAGRMGAKVALIEDEPVLGGMLSNGLTNIDTFSRRSLSGIFDEFRRDIEKHYAPIMSRELFFTGSAQWSKEDAPVGGHRTGWSVDPRQGGMWEPHVADLILKRMMTRVPDVRIFYNTYATGVVMNGNRIVGVVTRNKVGQVEQFFGKVVIDATPEGDVAAWAGVPYRIGREARSRLEPHAGRIHFLDKTGEILPGSTGRQDRAIPSSGLLLTVKVYDENDGPAPKVPKPTDYHESAYARASCWRQLRASFFLNGEFEMYSYPFGNEMQGINWNWVEDTRAQRHDLYDVYKNHALGFLYFQQHDCGLHQVGLPKDEYVDNGYVPYRPYIREGRRIQGMATMTEADINPFIVGHGLIPRFHTDSIAIGDYAIDSKPVTEKADFSRPDKGDGDFFLVNASAAFQVPYGAIVPEKVNGLLVPVAMSATHVAYSAIRMEPTFMAMGQAAGTAAVLSIREGVELRDLSVDALQRNLIRQKCRLVFYWDVPLDAPSFSAIQWLSVKGIIQGFPDRSFRPDQAITRAELASWIVKVLRLWPSVSNVHFSDVPYDAPHFRAIETLFDNSLLRAFAIEPMWPKVSFKNGGFAQTHGAFGEFHPTRAVLWAELISLLKLAPLARDSLMKSGRVPYTAGDVDKAYGDMNAHPDAPVTRGQAAVMLFRLM